MAKQRRKNDVSDWKARLNACMNTRQDVERLWDITCRQYEDTLDNNRGEVPGKAKQSKIRVNLAFPTIKVLLRASCASDPFICIAGVNPRDEDSAALLQYLENRLWRIQKRKRVIRKIVLDTLLMKVGYGISHIRKDPYTGNPEIFLTRVSPRSLWLEEGATSVNDAYYIFREVLIPRAEAEAKWKGVRFPTYDRKTKQMQISTPPESSRFGDDEMDRVAIYEVHDQLYHEIAYMVPTHNKYLVDPRPSPYPFETMFTELIFNEIIDEHYGLSDLEPVSAQQDELDRVRSAMLTHTKRMNRKYKVQEEDYKEDRLTALESGEDGAMVKVTDMDNIQVLEDANMSSDTYNYAEIVRGDHREITGINEYMNAGRITGTKTAYETEQIMSGARVRIGEKPELVEDFSMEVAIKDIDMMKKLYTVPQLVGMVGPEGQEVWAYIQQQQLQGSHYVTIHPGSMQPRDDTSDFQRGIILYQTFGNDPSVNHDALLNEVLALMNIRNRARLLSLPEGSGGPLIPKQSQGGPQVSPYGMNPESRQLPQFNAMRAALGKGGTPE